MRACAILSKVEFVTTIEWSMARARATYRRSVHDCWLCGCIDCEELLQD